ncbi:MAG TPA: OmpA family protein [Roseiarcus sp.]|nr:OmpA family protein [Roseiarcus sp.]
MRNIPSALAAAVMLLCGLACDRAAAADAEVRYVITNGGVDVQGHGQVHYFPNGKRDGSFAWASSGDNVRIPEGVYSVDVTFSDGAARKEIWLDDQKFSGKVERTVEIGLPMTEARYIITNGGVDVQGHGQVHYFPNGKRDGSFTWASSGDVVRMPEGVYSVDVTFSDGAARKEIWLDDQKFSGKVERTVEIDLAMTEARYIITNGGVNVLGHGQVHYFPNGKRDGSFTWASSGDSVRMPEGVYSVEVTFDDGVAHKEIWLDDQKFSGKVERTVEITQQVAEVRYVITNGGVDVKGEGQVHYFPNGKRDGSFAWASSDDAVRMPDGVYTAEVTFDEGAAHKAIWFDDQNFSGKVEKKVELGITLAEPMVTVTKDEVDAGPEARVEYFHPKDSQGIGVAANGQALVIEAGTYDIRASLADAEGWLRAAAIAGKPHLTIELKLPKVAAVAPAPAPANLALAAPAATPERIAPEQGDFPYLPPLPGSEFVSGKADAAPVYVKLPDAKQPELVANASIVKAYRPPAGLTIAALLAGYRDALVEVGWSIVGKSEGADAGLAAHYGRSGRNIWAFIRQGEGVYLIIVADATIVESELAADLGAKCHFALTGVLFDFNKSKLKPESDAVLEEVGAIMAKDEMLTLEVQGHTDNVGSTPYNQRLSEARAKSVVTWLTKHDVAAHRLSARGYGKTRPIASNDTDEGRAKNRRVEIANPACKGKDE